MSWWIISHPNRKRDESFKATHYMNDHEGMWVWTSWSPFPSALKLTLNLSMSTFCTSHEVWGFVLQISHLRKVVGCYPSMKNLAKQPKANVKGVIASGAAIWWSFALGQHRSSALPPRPRLWPFIGLLVVWETRPWAFGGATWTAELMQPQGKSLRWIGLESEWLIDFECWSSPGFH